MVEVRNPAFNAGRRNIPFRCLGFDIIGNTVIVRIYIEVVINAIAIAILKMLNAPKEKGD